MKPQDTRRSSCWEDKVHGVVNRRDANSPVNEIRPEMKLVLVVTGLYTGTYHYHETASQLIARETNSNTEEDKIAPHNWRRHYQDTDHHTSLVNPHRKRMTLSSSQQTLLRRLPNLRQRGALLCDGLSEHLTNAPSFPVFKRHLRDI